MKVPTPEGGGRGGRGGAAPLAAAAAAVAVDPPVVIDPPGRLVWPDLPDLWRHRSVLWVLVWRNVTRRYRQTLLGPLWFVINPLVRMLLFSVILGSLAGLPSDGVPYPIFTYAALLPWELFASGVDRGTDCLVSYHHIISKVYFPRLILPAAEVVTALVDFGLSFGILILMMFAYGFTPSVRMLSLPLFLGLAMVTALGVSLLLAPVHAHWRDTSNFVRYLVQLWFYGTPVAYASGVLLDRVPEWVGVLYRLNPMNGVVEGFRWALIDTGRPPDASFWVSAAASLLLLFVGTLVFLRAEQSIVDLA